MRFVAVIASACCFGSAAHADDAIPKKGPAWETAAACRDRLKDPTRCFAAHARAGMAICSMTWQLALFKGDSASAAECIRTAEEAMPPHFAAARKALAKNKPAGDALKDAYAQWLTAIRGLSPVATGETSHEYRLRTSQQEQEVERRLNRLEIEL